MIYLDNQATTACDHSVVDVMLPYFSTYYGNASSNHSFGQNAAFAITKSKEQVARLIGAMPEEVIFTSGATESNNLALLGLTRQYRKNGGKKRKLVTTIIEHKAVLGPFDYLSRQGWEIDFLKVDNNGFVDLEKAKETISKDTFLLSVQSANSEIGTLQPIRALASIAHENNVIFHCDAAQSVGKVPINVHEADIDFLSLSSHKMYGPKGVGALYINEGILKNNLIPLMFGGGQFKGLRPGTLPVPLIAGFGQACDLCTESMNADFIHTGLLRDEFENILQMNINGIIVNGFLTNRLPNNSSITFPDMDAEALLANIPEVVASTGAACESGSIEPSRILKAIGLSDEKAYNTVRFGLGRFTSKSDITEAASLIIQAYQQLKTMC